MRGGGGRKNAILSDEELLDAVSGTDLGNQLNDFGVPVASITSNDKE